MCRTTLTIATSQLPVPTPEELTTTSAIKLRGFPHFLEPNDDDIAQSVEDGEEHPLTKWSSYAKLQAWLQHHYTDYNIALEDSGRVEVGKLRGTARTVYAEVVMAVQNPLRRKRDIAKDAHGCLQIRLVASPFDHSKYFSSPAVPEAELTGQYGLDGFCACAEVLDWSIVNFSEDFSSHHLENSYCKILQHILDNW